MKKGILILFLLIISIFTSINVFAGTSTSVNTYINPLGGRINTASNGGIEDLPSIVGRIGDFAIEKIFGVIGIIVLVVFIYAGIKYIFALGDSNKVKKANGMIKWCLIGMIITFGAYIITKAVLSFVNSIALN